MVNSEKWIDLDANQIAAKAFHECQERWGEISDDIHPSITIHLANEAYREFRDELDRVGVFPTLAGYRFKRGAK